jgi:hypothetical protein
MPGVRITSNTTAFSVWVSDIANPDVMLEDNALDLLPGDDLWIPTEHCRTGEPLASEKPVVWWVGKGQSF